MDPTVASNASTVSLSLAPTLVQVSGNIAQTFGHFRAHRGGDLGVFGHRFLAQDRRDRFQQHQQALRGGHDDVALGGVRPQLGVLFKSRIQEHLRGHEHHHELRRTVRKVPILLVGELVDVSAHVLDVHVHLLFAVVVVAGFVRVQERVQNLDPWTGTAFSLVAVVTAVSALEPFFAWRPLWVAIEKASYRFNRLRDELQFYVATTAPEHLGPQQIRDTFEKYQRI